MRELEPGVGKLRTERNTDHWTPYTLAGRWWVLWERHAGVDSPVPRHLTSSVIGYLQGLHRSAGLEQAEVADLMLWWWTWKWPRLVQRAPDVQPPVVPAALPMYVQEYRIWTQARLQQIAQYGLDVVIERGLEVPPPPAGWVPPARWSGPA